MRKCGNCGHFAVANIPNVETKGGICRRFPPQVTANKGQHLSSAFSATDRNAVCGEHSFLHGDKVLLFIAVGALFLIIGAGYSIYLAEKSENEGKKPVLYLVKGDKK